MPISLKKGANAQQARNAYSPKYFCSALTGYYTASGKIAERGMLNQNADPCRVKPGIHQLVHDDINIRRRTIGNGGVTTNLIPISLVPATFWDAVATMPVPDLTRAIQLGTLTMRGITRTAYLELDVHSIVHESERTDHGTSQRLRTTWRMSLWMLRDDRVGSDATVSNCYRFSNSHSATAAASSAGTAYDNAVYVAFDADVSGAVRALVRAFVACGWTVDEDAVEMAFEGVHTLDSVARASHDWQTCIDQVAIDAIQRLCRHNNGSHTMVVEIISDIMHRLEAYPVSLGFYRPIYDGLRAEVSADDLSQLVKSNLNLLLTDTMMQLDAIKPTLNRLPTSQTAAVDPFFSPEQATAIASHEPLVLIQSAAGSGKSTTIKGRIRYMIDSGVDPHDITVLSFTNAAADHIREIAPNVNSMTIASMVHTIYAANFDHELSSIPTLMNALDIWFPQSVLATNFKHYLRAVADRDTSSFTQLNNFVERNYDGIVELLDTCGQTTLELEIIMCYQHIGDYVEPPEVTSKHLIVDEVQDNSIFEFVYTLKYISKHLNSLYIVGRRIADVKPYELRETRAYAGRAA